MSISGNSLKAVIFDFDGTLVDTEDFIAKIYNIVAEKSNFKVNKIETHDISAFRKMKGQEIYRKLNITPFNLPFIAFKMHKSIRKRISEIRMHYGISDLLAKIKAKNYITCILSTNNLKVIKKYLMHNQIDCFDHVFTSNKIFGKDKALKKIIRQLKLTKENVIYIGDEIRDIIASHKAGIKIISVSWGFNDRASLEKENPQHIVETPDEILNYI